MGQDEFLSKKKAEREWKQYFCGSGEPTSYDDRKVPLEAVRHIAHVSQAQHILADGGVAASLIRDECRLRATRTSVVWLSANNWSQAAAGSIYGGVEFVFDWRKIVAEYPHIYWVEDIRSYKSPAYRFLLAKKKVTSDLVVRYDPSSAEGPLVRENGEWFCNGDCTSEFMVADDLDLDRWERIGFVPHRRCRRYGNQCSDKHIHEASVRLLVLAYVLASRTHAGDGILATRDQVSMNQFDWFIERFCDVIGESCGSRIGVKGSNRLRATTRAILALWSYRDFDSAERLAGLLPDQSVLRSTLCVIVAEHLGCDRYRARTMKDCFAESRG